MKKMAVCITAAGLMLLSAACSNSSKSNNDADVQGDGLMSDSDVIAEGQCVEDQVRLMACGENKEKVQAQICKKGKWENKGDCADSSDTCVEGEARFMACEGGKVQKQVCVDGKWGELGPCGESTAAQCAENDKRTLVCGLNNMQEQEQVCTGGKWINEGECSDAAVCKNGEQKYINCGTENGALQKKVCIDQRWETAGDCEVPGSKPADSSKTLKRKVYKNGYGQITGIEEFDYSAEGRLFRTVMYDANGNRIAETEKDQFGNIIKQISRNTNGSFASWKEQAYDTEGKYLIKEITRNAAGLISSWKEYDRFEKGNVKKEIQKNNDGNVISEKEYLSVEPGYSMITKETTWDDYGNITYLAERQPLKGLLRLVRQFVENNYDYTYSYNTDGLLTKETRLVYFSDGGEQSAGEWVYDWQNYKGNANILKKEASYIERNVYGEIIKERTYNDKLQPLLDACTGTNAGDCSGPSYFFDGTNCQCLGGSCAYLFANSYRKEWTYDALGNETGYKYEVLVRETATNKEKMVTVEERKYSSGRIDSAITGQNCSSATNNIKTKYEYYTASDGTKSGMLKKESYYQCPGSYWIFPRVCNADNAPYNYKVYDYSVSGGKVAWRLEQTKTQKETELAFPAVGTTLTSCAYYTPTMIGVRYSYQYGVTSNTTANTTKETAENVMLQALNGQANASPCTITSHNLSYNGALVRYYAYNTANLPTYLRQNSVEEWYQYDTNGNQIAYIRKPEGAVDYSDYLTYAWDSFNRHVKTTRFYTVGVGTNTPSKEETIADFAFIDIQGGGYTYGAPYTMKEEAYYNSASEHRKTSEKQYVLSMTNQSSFISAVSVLPSLQLLNNYNYCHSSDGSCGTFGSKNADIKTAQTVIQNDVRTDTTTVQYNGAAGTDVEVQRVEYKIFPISNVYNFYFINKIKEVCNYEKCKTIYRHNPSRNYYELKTDYDMFSETRNYNFSDFLGWKNNLKEIAYLLTGVAAGTSVTETISERTYNTTFGELTKIKQTGFCTSTTSSCTSDTMFRDLTIAYNEYGQATEYTDKNAFGTIISYRTASWVQAENLPWKAFLSAYAIYADGKETRHKTFEFAADSHGFPTKIWKKQDSVWVEYVYEASTEYDQVFGDYFWFKTLKPLTTDEKLAFYSSPSDMATQQQMMILPVKTETFKKMDGAAIAVHDYSYVQDTAGRPSIQSVSSNTEALSELVEFDWGK